ncbi:MAG: PhzF family phenazine biosynthesis isomerase [Woeseiaceae bacterium]|nr:PhzF family phenazine biosynthesis isomerase [Woeseiaceae bacterium]
MSDGKLYHLAAFAQGDKGGNPAGVWVGDQLPPPEEMQRIAADVGASETAFVAPASGERRTVRYYSPEIEVSFCGHATIATGVVLGQEDGEGTYTLDTLVGPIEVTALGSGDNMEASLRSIDTKQESITDESLQEALDCLGWSCDDLDESLPAVKAWAGAWHYVIAVTDKHLLDTLDYNFDRLKALMRREGLTTLQLIWREREDLFHSRNPFPIGGVVEDPATGAAAAAFGGYLRDAGLMDAPASFVIRQGDVMGVPSVIRVNVPERGGIVVSGFARSL